MSNPIQPIQDSQQTVDPNSQGTNNPQGNPVDPNAELKSYLGNLAQTIDQRLNGFQQNIDSIRTDFNQRINQPVQQIQSPPPPLPNPSEDLQGYLNGMFNQLRGDLGRTVEPINQFRQQQENQNNYRIAKQRFAFNNPQLQQYWNMIEPNLDQAFASGQVQPTDQSIAFAVNAIFGQLVQQAQRNAMFGIPNGNQNNQINNQNNPVPPFIPNTQQNNQINNQQVALRQLNENEKRIARENGMTDAEYLKGQQKDGPMQLAAAGTQQRNASSAVVR